MNTQSGGPVINPAQNDEQGDRLSGPKPGASGIAPAEPVKSPLNIGSQNEIISASGLGASRHMNQNQFSGSGGSAPEEGAGEGAEGAGELGELADLAPLALA
jgi:hypothetical protein